MPALPRLPLAMQASTFWSSTLGSSWVGRMSVGLVGRLPWLRSMSRVIDRLV